MSDQYSFRVPVEQVESGQYLSTSDQLPGPAAQGSTVEETLEIAGDVARRLVESSGEHGDELPAVLRRLDSTFDLDVAVTALWADLPVSCTVTQQRNFVVSASGSIVLPVEVGKFLNQ